MPPNIAAVMTEENISAFKHSLRSVLRSVSAKITDLQKKTCYVLCMHTLKCARSLCQEKVPSSGPVNPNATAIVIEETAIPLQSRNSV